VSRGRFLGQGLMVVACES